MSFENYINQAWADHAENPQKVSEGFKHGISLIQKTEQITQLAALIVHVMGEHLNKWQDGIEVLTFLSTHSLFEKNSNVEEALSRCLVTLRLCENPEFNISNLCLSDQIRVLAGAASALMMSDLETATKFYNLSLKNIELGLDRNDPAFRFLAITSNNMACVLEEKKTLSDHETKFMINAALNAKKYWSIAGTWLEIERAEYRLAQSFLKANDSVRALAHAQACVEICRENSADLLELFFGYEVLASVEKARSNQLGFQTALAQAKLHFEKLGEDDKTWCKTSLDKLL